MGNLEGKIQQAKEELHSLHLRGEVVGLSTEEVEKRRKCASNIYKLSSLNCGLLWQKSKMK